MTEKEMRDRLDKILIELINANNRYEDKLFKIQMETGKKLRKAEEEFLEKKDALNHEYKIIKNTLRRSKGLAGAL